ncbi:hypothetical protein [Deinococcus sp. AJ005]|uniref:hypothetical protein n=1 Tax=Deinococcus sp. AJ005 TaxID=2652443 RepID=UPI00125CCE3C|nr:hypothetical protein [Deinococcus sp. AJ005]QFP77990.1 hypothetical protein DAAJ005_17210 [Deinococcus sp. AJ005]
MLKTLFLTLTLAALPAASATSTSITLTAGQTVTSGGAKITLLRFSDSRCPVKAICVMAGNVKASVFVVRGKSARLYTVYLPGVPIQTAAGKVVLKAATRLEDGSAQRLTFLITQ